MKLADNNHRISPITSNSTSPTSYLQGMKAAFYTLGCKLNFAETSALGDQLEMEGVEKAQKGEIADICIINTCSVTETSEHKCRQTIHKAIRENPGAFVMVTGCYAQLAAEKLASIAGVDLVLGTEQKGQILSILKKKLPLHLSSTADYDHSLHEAIAAPYNDIRSFAHSCSRGERTRYFLKVQDGCNYFCTYCTIPYARGRSRNGSIDSLVEQAQKVAEQGGKEIVITGVNIGDFGKSTGETFFELIQALDEVKGIERYRISSIEPNLLTDEIIRFCAHSRAFMPHFHIPLQSGSDGVLQLMRRRYNTAFFAEKIQRVKELIPDAFIGVDIIVGTRGETDDLFEESFRFAQSINVSQYHVFSYSERPGTQALKIDHKVTDEAKHQRSQRLLSLSEEKRIHFYQHFIGSERTVLIEHTQSGKAAKGFTDNYIRVEIPELMGETDNLLVKVTLTGFNDDQSALIGIIKQDL